MPRIVSVPLSLEQRERLIFLAKHAKHWRERQRAQTILWLSEGKSVAEVATLQERIPETIGYNADVGNCMSLNRLKKVIAQVGPIH